MRWAAVPLPMVKASGYDLLPESYLGPSKTQAEHELKQAETQLTRAQRRVTKARRRLQQVANLPEGQAAVEDPNA